jgi:transcriptional regulator with XRE-family HTH domain
MQAVAQARFVDHRLRMRSGDTNSREQKLLGQALKALRERAEMTQEDAATRFGVGNAPAWSKYERGLAPSIFQPDVQQRLVAALGASMQDLLLERARFAGQEVAAQATGAAERGRPFQATPMPGLVAVYGRPAATPGSVDLAPGAEIRFMPMHPAQRGYERTGIYEVVGEAMHPRWKPRELAYFVFDLDPPRGDDVIVDLSGGGAILREYVGRTSTHLSLRRFYPEEAIEDVPLAEVTALHAVVG